MTYVTLGRELQSELCWCSRIVVERIKTDQRTRALEVLCVGAFAHFSPLRDVVGAVSIREAFETDDGATSVLSSWATDPNALRAWERMRMVYPYLQLTYLAAQALQPPEHATSPVDTDGKFAEALVRATAALGAAPDRVQPSGALNAQGSVAWDVEGVPALLRKIGETNPEEKTTNSLLYWLIDLLYNRALATSEALRFERTQFILERPQSRETMFAAVADVGRLVGTLVEVSRALDGTPDSGSELLGLTKVFEAHTTLMQSLRDALTQVRAARGEGLVAAARVAGGACRWVRAPPRVLARSLAHTPLPSLPSSPLLSTLVLMQLPIHTPTPIHSNPHHSIPNNNTARIQSHIRAIQSNPMRRTPLRMIGRRACSMTSWARACSRSSSTTRPSSPSPRRSACPRCRARSSRRRASARSPSCSSRRSRSCW